MNDGDPTRREVKAATNTAILRMIIMLIQNAISFPCDKVGCLIYSKVERMLVFRFGGT